MIFSGTNESGETVTYQDGKRYLWLLGLIGPGLIVPLMLALYFTTGSPLACLFPLFYQYVMIPAADAIFKEDRHNPPEAVVPAMSRDPWYKVAIYLPIPLQFLSFFAVCWFIGTQGVPLWAMAALTWSAGLGAGGIMTLTHELGHRTNKTDRRLAKIGNALIGYGHFNIEHNAGHHVHVATPEDPASARMGESLYRFGARELSGCFKRGWALERRRLERLGKPVYSHHNEILQVYVATAIIAAGLVAAFGWIMVPFLLVHHFIGWTTLTQANYIEHYGLKRQKLENGRYERVQPKHSWNSNHIISNLLVYNLERHSDHHAHPQRPYQALRDHTDIPRLPTGYMGCFALALVPPLWFKIMDPKVMDWADGDISKVNLDVRRADTLMAKFGRAQTA